jgi:trk system potassium uptake protein TrkA
LAAIDFVDFMQLSQDTGVIEIVAPDNLVGKSLAEAAIRQEYGLAVVAIKRGENDVVISPGASEVIQADDILVVLGRTSDCERLR